MNPELPARRPLRATLATVLLVALASVVSGCAAGNDATTVKFYSPGDGQATVVGSLRVLNALVVAPATPGGPALVSMTVANDGAAPQDIARITAAPFGEVQLTGSRTAPAKGVLTFGGPGSASTAVIPSFPGKAGESVTLDIDFTVSSPIRGLRVVVVPPAGYYQGWVLTPAPSAPAPSQPLPSGATGEAPAQGVAESTPTGGTGTTPAPEPAP